MKPRSSSLLCGAALTFSLLGVACGSSEAEPTGSASEEVSTAWLQANIPPGSALEAKALALVNDRTMTEARFVSECGYTRVQAAAILAYRTGDDPIATIDDQRFETLSELDAVPFTDIPFWANTARCAILHTAGPSVCVPGDHPPVIVELLVDESGSMSGDKWTATRDSLLTLYEKLHASGDPSVLIGTATFDDDVIFKVAPRAMTDEQLEELRSRIDRPSPHGMATGIEKALAAGFGVVDHTAGASIAGARRIVVLLSDGAPSGGDSEKTRSIELATNAHARGIDLYAVGIGDFPSTNPNTYDPAFMGALAQRGGTAPAGCDTQATDLANVCHVQITPGAGVTKLETDLTNALEAIRAASTPPAGCP